MPMLAVQRALQRCRIAIGAFVGTKGWAGMNWATRNFRSRRARVCRPSSSKGDTV